MCTLLGLEVLGRSSSLAHWVGECGWSIEVMRGRRRSSRDETKEAPATVWARSKRPSQTEGKGRRSRSSEPGVSRFRARSVGPSSPSASSLVSLPASPGEVCFAATGATVSHGDNVLPPLGDDGGGQVFDGVDFDSSSPTRDVGRSRPFFGDPFRPDLERRGEERREKRERRARGGGGAAVS